MNGIGPNHWTKFDTGLFVTGGIMCLLAAVAGAGSSWAALGLLLLIVAYIMKDVS